MNVYHFFRQDELESETDVELRTATATGISVQSLHRIKRQQRCARIKSPPTMTRITSVMRSVDNFAKKRNELSTVGNMLVRRPPERFPDAYFSLYRL